MILRATIGAVLPLLVVSAAYRALLPPDFVATLQVGQGDCTVVRSGGQTMVVDTGPASVTGDSWGRLVAPGLRKLGVGHVDILVLSHADADHNGNLDYMVQTRRVGKIIASAESKPRGVAGPYASGVDWVSGEGRFRLGRADVRFFAPVGSGTDNSESLCVQVKWPGASAVLTGDAPASVEQRLIQLGWDRSSLVKVGHHGSSSATSQEWIDWNRPEYAVASCGRSNAFGHPSAAVVGRLRASGAKVLTTSWDGTQVFVPTADGFVRTRRGT